MKKSTIKIILLFLIGAILFSPWGTELYTKITFWTIIGSIGAGGNMFWIPIFSKRFNNWLLKD